MALSLLVGLVELCLTGMVTFMGVAIASPTALAGTAAVRMLRDFFPATEPFFDNQANLLAALLACIVVTLLCKTLANVLLTWKQELYSQKVSAEFGQALLRGYLYGSYLWHVGQELAQLSLHLGWRAHVASFLLQTLMLATQICIGVFLLGAVFIVAPVVGAIVLSVTGLCAILTYKFSRKRIGKLSSLLAEEDRIGSRITLPALQGIRDVIIYRQQEAFLRQYREYLQRVAALRARIAVTHPITPWCMELVGMSTLLAAVLYMRAAGFGIAYLTGTLALLAGAAWRLMPTLNRFVSALLVLRASLPFIRPVLKRLDEVIAFGDSSDVTAEPCPLTKRLELRNVSFRYPRTLDGKPDSLRHVSITVPRGGMVGFIGPSGAGKSTLVGLLTGLFPATTGEILVDGKPLTPGMRAGWVNSIGYVPQSPFLLNATIAENVAFSSWGGRIDDARVQECCRMAAIDFLDELPEGVHTRIGERGIRLSGGQIQRVSIARALYGNPQMVLFDEATSALDGASEQAIQKTIESLRDRITLVMVAHRLATVRNCDCIYWIDEGKIQKAGTPSEVLPAYEAYLNAKAQTMLTC